MQHQAAPAVEQRPAQRAAPQQTNAPEEEEKVAADKPEVTQGIHNVVVSGKGDMMAAPRNRAP